MKMQYISTNKKNLYLVADGMGGCNAGEVASSTAISAFVKSNGKCRKWRNIR